MGSDTDHIRKIGNSVAEAKRLKREIGTICGEIDALLAESKAAKHKRKQRKARPAASGHARPKA
jgi:hypothetical protein